VYAVKEGEIVLNVLVSPTSTPTHPFGPFYDDCIINALKTYIERTLEKLVKERDLNRIDHIYHSSWR